MATKAIIARLVMTAWCPDCGESMSVDPEELIFCASKGCSLRGISFLPPKTELTVGSSIRLVLGKNSDLQDDKEDDYKFHGDYPPILKRGIIYESPKKGIYILNSLWRERMTT